MTRLFVLPAMLAAAATATASTPNSAPPPGVMRQTPTPATYRFAVGDARVTALSDGTVAIDLHQLLRGSTAAETDAALARGFLVNPVEASINGYLVESGDRLILVDTGAGELFGPGNGGRLAEALAAVGMDPRRVTDILLTHVHTDHSGGLARGGRMLFPNALVHAGKGDVDFFLDPAKAGAGGYDKRYWTEAARTLKLYADAARVRAFDRRTEILPGIVAVPHPGHTPGSAFYELTSAGQRIVFVGDIVHAAAVQFPHPAVTIVFDQDPAQARAVRQQAFRSFARDRTLIAAPHLSFPGVGHVAVDGQGYRWIPLDHGDRDPGTVIGS